jgi:hypothetical protein
VNAEYERLTEIGVTFTQPPTDIGPAVIAVFDDTSGNLIQLIAERPATTRRRGLTRDRKLGSRPRPTRTSTAPSRVSIKVGDTTGLADLRNCGLPGMPV